MINFQARQLCSPIFSPHTDVLKISFFSSWLKSASISGLPGTIVQFILQISAQTLLPVWHLVLYHSQSPQMRELSYMLTCHRFIISSIQLWATWGQGRCFSHLCISVIWHGAWSELVFNKGSFEWINKSKIKHGHICHFWGELWDFDTAKYGRNKISYHSRVFTRQASHMKNFQLHSPTLFTLIKYFARRTQTLV